VLCEENVNERLLLNEMCRIGNRLQGKELAMEEALK